MRKINYPLIVSDFDGTLVNADGTIGEENIRAIEEYRAAGGNFVISTGRLPAGILPRAVELGLSGLICCCQGAIILDVASRARILDGKMSLQSTLAACRAMEELGLHIHVYDFWEYYANQDNEALKAYEAVVQTKAKVITDKKLSEFIEEEGLCAYKLLAIVDRAQGELILQRLKDKRVFDCVWTRSSKSLVEAISPNYSKGTAVEFLAKHYGIPVEKTVAVGDQQNDIPMIEAAGLGIAVKNADSRLKEKADYICDYTNEENAIAKIIEKFGFYEEEHYD